MEPDLILVIISVVAFLVVFISFAFMPSGGKPQVLEVRIVEDPHQPSWPSLSERVGAVRAQRAEAAERSAGAHATPPSTADSD